MPKKRIPVEILFWETDITNYMGTKFPSLKHNLDLLLQKTFSMKIVVKPTEEVIVFINQKRAREKGARLKQTEKVIEKETFNFRNVQGHHLLTKLYRFLDPHHDIPKDISGGVSETEVEIEGLPRHAEYRVIDKIGRVSKRRIKRSRVRRYYKKRKMLLRIKRKDGRTQGYWVSVLRKKK